jgi:hypothetical protein
MIYARLYSVINGTTVYNDYTYTAASLARLTSPAPTSIFTSNVVQFTWSPGGGVTDYDLHLSAVAPGDADLYSSGQNTGTTTVVSKLPTNGGPIYARLYSIINGVTYYNDYTYTALSIAKLTSPVSGSTLTSTDLAFKWSAANVSAQYDLHLSTVAAGDADLYSSGHVAGTAAVAKVPGNGETVFARLYTIIGGGTYYNDFTYTAK